MLIKPQNVAIRVHREQTHWASAVQAVSAGGKRVYVGNSWENFIKHPFLWLQANTQTSRVTKASHRKPPHGAAAGPLTLPSTETGLRISGVKNNNKSTFIPPEA